MSSPTPVAKRRSGPGAVDPSDHHSPEAKERGTSRRPVRGLAALLLFGAAACALLLVTGRSWQQARARAAHAASSASQTSPVDVSSAQPVRDANEDAERVQGFVTDDRKHLTCPESSAVCGAGLRDRLKQVEREVGGLCESRVPSGAQPPSTFVALNLHNSEAVLPYIRPQLKALLRWLQPSGVFLSVYESGSSDGTVPMLQMLSAELRQLEVPHLINTSAHDVRGSRNRLQFLADMRNAALAPMLARGAATHERLLFLNDVLFCAADVALLLLGDHRTTDMACGMDWYKEPDHLYDTWVSTDLEGTKLLHHHPYVQHADAAALLAEGSPFPVYCCWNGAVSVSASLLYPPASISFHGGRLGECPTSECLLFCSDIWRARGAQGRAATIVVEPRLRVAYEVGIFRRLSEAGFALPPPPQLPAARFRFETPMASAPPRTLTFFSELRHHNGTTTRHALHAQRPAEIVCCGLTHEVPGFQRPNLGCTKVSHMPDGPHTLRLATAADGAAARQCVGWRASQGCDYRGGRDEASDRPCDAEVPSTEAGFCECSGGVAVAARGCPHEPLRCDVACSAPLEWHEPVQTTATTLEMLVGAPGLKGLHLPKPKRKQGKQRR